MRAHLGSWAQRRSLAAWLLIVAPCCARAEGEHPDASVAATASVTTSEPKPEPARSAPSATPPEPPPAPVGDAMRFVERKLGPKPPGAPKCAPGPPCVTDTESAFVVSAAAWPEHYLIDFGVPTAAIFDGLGAAPRRTDTNARIEAAVRAVLAKKGASEARVHCSAAGRLLGLLKTDEWVPIVLPRDPPPGTSSKRAPDPVTPEQANRLVSDAYAKIGYRKQPKLFFGEETGRMTGDTLSDPRIDYRMAFAGTDKSTKVAEIVALWSPESRRVYVLDRSKEMPKPSTLKGWEEQREADVGGLVRALGMERVRVHVSQLCAFPKLAPHGAWMSAALR